MELSEKLPCNVIVCRYDEIATKGQNRPDFEKRLSGNIQRKLNPIGTVRISRQRGRLYIYPPKGEDTFSTRALERIYEELPRVFGIASFSPAIVTEASLPSLEQVITDTFPTAFEYFSADKQSDEKLRYAMRVRGKSMDMDMSSQDIEIHFADQLLETYPLQVDLRHPEIRVEVELRNDNAYVSYERIAGPGGLPTGAAPPLIGLLSGGIDSPVACYQAMKRGHSVFFLTFHSAPYTPESTITKAARLADVLNQWQKPRALVAVNLLPAQKQIRDACWPRLRTVLYRRIMVRIATRLAAYYQAQGLVTGDSLGQVASQTLENMTLISHATNLLILRPLLTFDKKESIDRAHAIGTLDISQEKTPDSCSVFAPEKPLTAAKQKQVAAQEERLDIEALEQACLNETDIISPETYEKQKLAEVVALTDLMSA